MSDPSARGFGTPGVAPAFDQPRNVVRPIEERQRDSALIEKFTPQMYRASIEHTMAGAGELVVDVAFPIVFTDKPVHFPSLELLPNEPTEDGNFPTVSMTVLAWNKVGTVYRGARVAFVTTGVTGQRTIVTGNFEGVAIVNPVGHVDLTGGG